MDAINKQLDFSDIVASIGDSFLNSLFNSTMSPQQKLERLTTKAGEIAQERRQEARRAGALVLAIADPQTSALEPLEAARAKRAKLVSLGGDNLNDPVRLAAIQTEIRALDESTLEPLEDVYETRQGTAAIANKRYKEALAAFDRLRLSGSTLVAAIEAKKAALKDRNEMLTDRSGVDTSIVDVLRSELHSLDAEIRTDDQIAQDLDASNGFSIDAELDKMADTAIDASLMEEFQAAAGRNDQ